MASKKRIKNLTLLADPTEDLFLPIDSDGTGTKKVTIESVLALAPGADKVVTVENFDDFADVATGGGWTASASKTAEADYAASGVALGFPSSGVISLRCSQENGSKVLFGKPALGMVLGSIPGQSIVIEWRFSGAWDAGESTVFADDECTWLLGAGYPDEEGEIDNAVCLVASWSGEIPTRTYSLTIVNGNEFFPESFEMPEGLYHTARITITEQDGCTLEMSTEDGDFVLLATNLATPPQITYIPLAMILKESGDGDRFLLLDYCKTTSKRAALDSNALAALPFPAYALSSDVQSGSYAPLITDEPANVTLTAPDTWKWSKTKDVVTIFGTIHAEASGGNWNDGGGNFTLPEEWPAALFGVGNGAGFWEDATRAATLKLNDDGDGFVVESFQLTDFFNTDIRFTFSYFISS